MAKVQNNATIGHYECTSEELMATLQMKDKVQGRLFLDVVIRKSKSPAGHLYFSKNSKIILTCI